MRRTVAAGLLALLMVTAGCIGGMGAGPATDAPTGDDTDAGDGASDGSAGSADGESGTVNFYVSDRPNDMDDFEHLNVTVTAVRFHLVDSTANGTDDENATVTPDGTVTGTATNGTATATATATPNGTVTATATPTPVADEAENESEDEPVEEDDRDEDAGERDDDGEDGRWVVREVNATTVDLTRLRGANATLVDAFDLPAGEYNQVVLEVSETNGTLTDGSSTEVKLPSERLKLNQRFVVGNGEEVDFVYDVTVHKAGNSGMYILRPVASESGTDVPIERVDDDGDDEDDGDALQVRFTDSVSPGENVTIRVTDRGNAVANATVSVDGAADGTTNADGEYTFTLPADAEEVEIEVTAGEREGELEREFGDSDDEDDERGNGEGQGNGA
jgi:hypothetical protein